MEEIIIGQELTTKEKIAAIDAELIRHMMIDYKIKKPRQLSILANISEASLNRALNGHRPPSSEIKNSLYWYFMYLRAESNDKNFKE
jgi:hypothetical protein